MPRAPPPAAPLTGAEQLVDVGPPLGWVVVPVAVDLPVHACQVAVVGGAPLIQGRVGAAHVGVLAVVRGHGGFSCGGGDSPDSTALFEAVENLDPRLDGELAALAWVVDHDVVPGAGALFAQQWPDLVE